MGADCWNMWVQMEDGVLMASVFLTLQSGDGDVQDVPGRDLASRVGAERWAGPRPRAEEAPGGDQRAQHPFVVSRAHISSRPSSDLRGPLLCLIRLLTRPDPAPRLPGGP